MDGIWRGIDEAAGRPRAFRAAGETAFAGRTVLVVEEDPTLAAALATALRTAGFRAVPSSRVTRALADFHQALPDLVILDLAVGARAALDLLGALRASGAIPVVVLCAGAEPALAAEALSEGACACVTKPFGVEALLTPLRAALAA